MKNGNGWILRFLIGIIWAMIFFALTFMGKSIIANDQNSRERDHKIEEKIYSTEKENGQRFERIMVILSKIETEQRLVKELIKNGNDRN